MGECGCDLSVTRCRDHDDDVVLVLSSAEAEQIDEALSAIISLTREQWFPATWAGAGRCVAARAIFRHARSR